MQAIIPFPDIAPELFSITLFGVELALRWYALAYIAGILIGWRLVVLAVRRPALWRGETPPMTAAQVEETLTWVIVGILLGGRLGFVLFYEPAYYLANPLQIPFVWQGGMSFHGGLLGVILALWLNARRYGVTHLSMADLGAIGTPAGLLFGRLANFINAELWGRPTDVPWAMIFPTDPLGLPRHPSQLYEAALEGLLLGVLIWAMAFFWGALKRPGLVAGVFFAGYGLSRFIVEYFRQADAQFITPDNPLGHVLGGPVVGVSMGQLLSLPMIAVGGVFLVLALRKRAS